jgi:hypothetical protein
MFYQQTKLLINKIIIFKKEVKLYYFYTWLPVDTTLGQQEDQLEPGYNAYKGFFTTFAT